MKRTLDFVSKLIAHSAVALTTYICCIMQVIWLSMTKNILVSHRVDILDLTSHRTCSLAEFLIIGQFYRILHRDQALSVGICIDKYCTEFVLAC